MLLLLSGSGAYCQCSDISVSLTGGHCVGDTFRINTTSGRLSRIDWYDGSQLVTSVNSTGGISDATVVAGNNGTGSAADQFDQPDEIYPATMAGQ